MGPRQPLSDDEWNDLMYRIKAKNVMKTAIAFHRWMKENDTAENAEQFFHFTDEDMFHEWQKQINSDL